VYDRKTASRLWVFFRRPSDRRRFRL